MPRDRRWFSPPLYGLPTFGDIFTARQLVALTTFSDLVGEAAERVRHDAVAAGLPDDDRPLRDGGSGATAYAEAVAVYLAFSLSKALTRNCTQTVWYTDRDSTMAGFSRQAIPMTWDFAEVNPLLQATGSIAATASWVAEVLEGSLSTGGPISHATQMDAAHARLTPAPVISTGPGCQAVAPVVNGLAAEASDLRHRRPLMISDSDRRTTSTCRLEPDRATSTTSRIVSL